MLKSDHFGIEINYTIRNNTTTNRLKSDHFGIEIPPLLPEKKAEASVKIRPFWD